MMILDGKTNYIIIYKGKNYQLVISNMFILVLKFYGVCIKFYRVTSGVLL